MADPHLRRRDALALRMASLLLAPRPASSRSVPSEPSGNGGGEPAPTDVAGVVTWLGAMQAQDVSSAAWSFGVRLPGLTTGGLAAAFERREAIRTWPMRGTVHYVPPRDAHWMLDLMGSRALAGAAKRRESLGLGQAAADRSVEILAAALHGGRRLSRARCLDALRAAGIDVSGQLGYHLLWYASQRGVTCFAPTVDADEGPATSAALPFGVAPEAGEVGAGEVERQARAGQTPRARADAFMLLDEFVPDPHRPDPEEALATIALRYFRGHGPTTDADLAGWTGLPVTQCRRGIAGAGAALVKVLVEDVPMWADRTLVESYSPGGRPSAVLALPGFDEYLLGYKDRALMLDAAHKQAIIPGGNGVFQPTVVLDGGVVGTWRRATKRGRIEVTVTELVPLKPTERQAVEAAFRPYGEFLGLPIHCGFTG